ncbi:MAG: PQQ-like beta-propeller repeat protein [Myxococcales bacterium]|nr:PQQ-like beta-propeller repeat protein [Myxococcales bacterium]MCB9733266.1 PQQ-like beta-propeller repeat protein [Deltaproteobacteria bacterium]
MFGMLFPVVAALSGVLAAAAPPRLHVAHPQSAGGADIVATATRGDRAWLLRLDLRAARVTAAIELQKLSTQLCSSADGSRVAVQADDSVLVFALGADGAMIRVASLPAKVFGDVDHRDIEPRQLIAGGERLVASDTENGTTLIADLAAAKPRWRHVPTDPDVLSEDGRLCFWREDDRVGRCDDPKRGRPITLDADPSLNFDGGPPSSLAPRFLGPDVLLFSVSYDASLTAESCAYGALTGKLRWSFPSWTPSRHFPQPDGTVWITGEPSSEPDPPSGLRALDPRDGAVKQLLTVDDGDFYPGSVSIADGVLYAAGECGLFPIRRFRLADAERLPDLTASDVSGWPGSAPARPLTPPRAAPSSPRRSPGAARTGAPAP